NPFNVSFLSFSFTNQSFTERVNCPFYHSTAFSIVFWASVLRKSNKAEWRLENSAGQSFPITSNYGRAAWR
ncbi:hypothetical protein, partial [Shouchella clausii]|uniref:hypothetical protein n=1 Tax=Shouchella clausii TaxID=79880 RepID=UPI00280C18B8